MSSATARTRVLAILFSRPGENYWEGGRRRLVVGNTARLVTGIVRALGGTAAVDVHELVPEEPYPEAYAPTVRRNLVEQKRGLLPGIAGQLPDIGGYDAVILAGPVWNTRLPMILRHAISRLPLAGRRVLPVVTYAIEGPGRVEQEVRELLPAAELAPLLGVRGEEVDGAATVIESWARENGLR